MAIGTTAALIGLGIAGAGAASTAYSASKQAGAAKSAAETQVAASNEAARMQLEASKYAADKQYQTAQESNALQEKMYEQGRADLEPWRTAGSGALTQLNELIAPGGELAQDFAYGDFNFEKDPGYQFRLEEGRKALERSAAARGTLMSGAQVKALDRYTQDYASSEYDKAYGRYDADVARAFNVFNSNRSNRFNSLASIAGVGQQATNQMVSQGAQYGANAAATNAAAAQNAASLTMTGTTNAANALMGGANAAAAGTIGSANAWSQGTANIFNNAAWMWGQLAKP